MSHHRLVEIFGPDYASLSIDAPFSTQTRPAAFIFREAYYRHLHELQQYFMTAYHAGVVIGYMASKGFLIITSDYSGRDGLGDELHRCFESGWHKALMARFLFKGAAHMLHNMMKSFVYDYKVKVLGLGRGGRV